MHPIVVVLCALVSTTSAAGWITDIISPRGLDVGSGLTLKLDELNRKNSSVFERLALRMNYGDLGVSLAKNPHRDALEVQFITNDLEEGRGRKNNMAFPFMIGFKSASVMTMVLGIMKLLVLKALIIAKFALVASAVILFAKLMKHEEPHHPPSYVEIEHHGSEQYPVYAEFGHSGGDSFHPGSTGNYYAYNNYAPSAVADSNINYATVESSAGNVSVAGGQQVAAGAIGKRRDYTRRKIQLPTILTVRRYSIET